MNWLWVLTLDHVHEYVEGLGVLFVGQLIVLVGLCLVGLLAVLSHLFTVGTEITHITYLLFIKYN